ncbi:META domain-containing protein [Flavobacterium sp. WW92]|uniref:META domain-containing protein n=1 Tax=unclassified Flavobacterium TaxID=196869 RepID=UPI0022248A0E|nr:MULTISPECIES: META domain-containing protein [unclassified Flavobacterium]WDO12048.1 META domain-containing protein [Flavobacterium sp. WW92]
MKKQFIIALTTLSFLCINCKPKSAEKEISSIDSLSIAKDTAVSIKKAGSIFFKATGTEPFWGIEISDDSIRFTTPETEKNFTLAYGKPNKAMDSNVISYEAKSDSIHLKFTIQQGACSDGMSDNQYAYKVKASLKRGSDKDFKLLEGCGNYIVDQKLQGTWILEELEGKTIDAKDFEKELPNVEINTSEAKFTGFAGCNRMGGKLFYEREILRFSDIFTTEMMCPNYDKEKLLVKALQGTTRYEIKDNKLYLFNPEGTKAIFRKKE